MKMIHTTLNEMGRINMQQSHRVIQAAQEARLRSKTRTARAFNHVGGNIQAQINRHSQG
ncbi:MAG TPA: hypothetical protein H9867_00665 [Candidatus Corynebacterium gallistercoris]|uniref:Uncharacterized protein n=1 Tax=Candidatus Corynebacterium gallistercoris TaxID=2838530 RepID=A0A9D1UP79_9CORY|nr:hypothetical protein [Candidatus Corynebacterium gallistercoris]